MIDCGFQADEDTNSLIILTTQANYAKVVKVLDELDKPVPQVLIKVLLAELTTTDATDVGIEWSVLNLRSNGDSFSNAFSYSPTPGEGFVSDILIQVLEEGSVLDLFANGSVEISLVIPAEAQGKNLALLYWDETSGAWIEIPVDNADIKYPADLNPDDPMDQRVILLGLSASQFRALTQGNFSGLFVLVAK